jgi:hypothetical protein
LAKESGYDGVELLYTVYTRIFETQIEDMCRDLGLGLRFHSGWTPDESTSPSIMNNALACCGILPNNFMAYEHRFSHRSVNVVYADMFMRNDVSFDRELHHLQTLSVYRRGEFFISYDDFMREVNYRALRSHNPLNFVFDTFHAIEWMLGMGQDDEFKGCDCPHHAHKILDDLPTVSEISEIHLADSNSVKERNVPLGRGKLQIREITRLLRQSRFWRDEMIVTPEIDARLFGLNPRNLGLGRKDLVRNLRSLKGSVEDYFR